MSILIGKDTRVICQGLTGAQAFKAQREITAKLEKDCAKSDELRCEVVSLYHGGIYDLYQYRRFQDVRLVFAPEFQIAFFGGDPDGGLRELRTLGEDPDPWVRAAALAASGHLALNRGQLQAAAADLGRAHADFTVIGDRWGLILSLAGLSEVAMARDDPDEAVRVLEEARGLAADGLHGNFADMMLVKLGQARARQGDIDAARADLERAVRLAERIGEGDDQAAGYLELAELARRTAEPGRAAELVQRALQITEANPRRPGMAAIAATAYGKLGCLAEQGGDLTAAARWQLSIARSSSPAFHRMSMRMFQGSGEAGANARTRSAQRTAASRSVLASDRARSRPARIRPARSRS